MTLSQTHIHYWKESAERNWKTALDLYKTKHYDSCLFFCHLTIEKYLKSLVVHGTGKSAPFTHDLVLLARIAMIELSRNQEELLRTITTFNISGRYDDEKFQFYKKATPMYTKRYLQKTSEFYLWLQKASSQKTK